MANPIGEFSPFYLTFPLPKDLEATHPSYSHLAFSHSATCA
jgi:hypothetical protein